MHKPRLNVLIATLFLTAVGGQALCAQASSAAQQDTPQAAVDVVRQLYDLVTFEAGTTPNWDEVRALFIDEAVVVLRTTRTATTVFSLEGFVNDFVTFIERANVEQTGFEEKILGLDATEFHDMAHAWVLYQASVPGSQRPPQQGVDSFSLIRRDGRWLIASITNDIPTPEHPIPAVLRD
jgi:hypothetical protein